MPVEELIQSYFWRWGIEVNFKEEKQLFGAGQAQLRNASSVSSAPAVCIATYAALLLAGIRAYGFHSRPPSVDPPKWYARKNTARVTSSDLIKQTASGDDALGCRQFLAARLQPPPRHDPREIPGGPCGMSPAEDLGRATQGGGAKLQGPTWNALPLAFVRQSGY